MPRWTPGSAYKHRQRLASIDCSEDNAIIIGVSMGYPVGIIITGSYTDRSNTPRCMASHNPDCLGATNGSAIQDVVPGTWS